MFNVVEITRIESNYGDNDYVVFDRVLRDSEESIGVYVEEVGANEIHGPFKTAEIAIKWAQDRLAVEESATEEDA